MARRTPNPQLLLFLATLGVCLTAVLPLRWTSWVGWFRGPLITVIAPVSGPLAMLADWLRPGEVRQTPNDLSQEDLRRELEFYKSEYLVAEQRLEEMSRVITALQDNIPYGPAVRLRRLEASRIGNDLGAGTFEVSRGSMHGVMLNSVAVAVAAPQHLVGIVTDVGPSTSTIHMVNDRRISPNLIEALLMPTGQVQIERLAVAPRCQFRPVGDDTFAGEIGAEDAARVQPGDEAFLDDPSWPTGAQRLILGRVVRIEDTDKPLFKRVVLRPVFDLSRVRAVVLRTPASEIAPPPPVGGGVP